MKNFALLLMAVLLIKNPLAAQQNVGIGTLTPNYPLDVQGFTFPGYFVINVRSLGNGSGIYSNIDNAAVAGLSAQSAIRGEAAINNGVSGITLSGNALAGYAETGKGIYASSLAGRAVDAVSAATGTAGYFYSGAGLGLIVEKGNVGIGITNPYLPFEVKGGMAISPEGLNGAYLRFRSPASGDSASMIFANNSYFAIESEAFGTSPASGLWINRSNDDLEPFNDNLTDLGTPIYRFKNIFAGNATIQTSDGRMKKNITALRYGLNTVMQLNPVTYHWKDQKDGERQQIGFIAQEVALLVPEAVVHSQVTALQLEQARAAGKPIPAITDPYGMKYDELIPVLTKAIQEQQLKIEQLEKELLLLKAKL